MPRTRRLPAPSLETKDDLLPSIVFSGGLLIVGKNRSGVES
ncbi:MAG TPA: hypothetical protein VD835_00445 [Pyrinomonadaceae bacterium]|nr:hypothetical protein [Pyrinomonadaceae bacterium]